MSTTQHRPRRSRAQWQTLIEQAEHSALSISEFCHAQDLSVSSFYQWRKRLAAEQGSVAGSAAAANPGTFIDLGALGNSADDTGPWDLELQLGNHVMLRLRRG
jgi:putative transposase